MHKATAQLMRQGTRRWRRSCSPASLGGTVFDNAEVIKTICGETAPLLNWPNASSLYVKKTACAAFTTKRSQGYGGKRASAFPLRSAKVPRVPQGIAAGLRINAHAMRSLAHFDACEQMSSRGVDSIDFVMI